MATTYTERPFYDGPLGRAYADTFTFRSPTREYATGDIIKLRQIARGTKLGLCTVTNQELDEDGSPTLTGVLELEHGTEDAVPLVSCAAATLGADDGVTHTNNDDALGYTTQQHGWWLQFRFTAANADPKTGILAFNVPVVSALYGNDPSAPTG
jgi:hypothetical protein